MKTFKLKMLEIVDYQADKYKTIQVPLTDGLIINREDNENRWLIEAFTDKELLNLFTDLKEKYEELIVHVKITTEFNEKATCITSIIDMNDIGEGMNVLFLGTMVDQRTSILEKDLEELVAEGNREEELLERFKEKI